MKKKNLLISLISLGAVIGLASCGTTEEPTSTPSTPSQTQTATTTPSTPTITPTSTPTSNPSAPTTTPSTVDPAEEAKEVMQAALDQLSIQSEINTASITLATTGIGGVSLVYTSSNADVITVNGGVLTVTQPTFGSQDVEVTITATAILDDYSLAKDFKVTVKALENHSTTVAEIKALAKGTAVEAYGVVTGFLYASGTTDAEYRAGFYLTDSTGTIYVYGSTTAATVEVGNEVYFSAEVGEYNSAKQLANPSKLQVITESKDADFSAAVKDKTIVEVNALGTAAIGNVYEMTVLVYVNDFGTYAIEDVNYETSKVSFNEYFSGSISSETKNYASLLKGKEGSVIRVLFYMNSTSSKGKLRGNVLAIVPFTDSEKVQYIGSALKSEVALNEKYTEETTVTLPATLEGYEDFAITYALAEGSTGATISEGALTITPTDSLQKFTLVATATKEGVAPVTITFDEVQVKNSFDPMTFAQYVASENGASVFVKGVVVYIGKKSDTLYYTYLVDAEGNGYLAYGDASSFEVGKTYTLNGVLSIYNSLYEITKYEVEEVTGADAITKPEMKDITSTITNYATVTKETQNQVVKFTGVATAAKTILVGETSIALYSQGITLALEVGKTYTVVGASALYNTNSQFYVFEQPVQKELTPEEKVNETLNAIKAQFENEFTANTEVTLENPYDLTLTVTVDTAETAIITYADGKITVTAPQVETALSQTFKIVVASGTAYVSNETTITVTAKNSSVVTTSLVFPTSGKKNLDSGNNTSNYSLFGLDSNVFDLVYTDVNANDSNISNFSTDLFKFYSGDTITISFKSGVSGTIKSISCKSSAGTGKYSLENLVVKAGTTTVTGTNGVYEINDTSLELSNTAQVRFTELSITYELTPANAE